MASKRLILLWREKATACLTFYNVCDTLLACCYQKWNVYWSIVQTGYDCLPVFYIGSLLDQYDWSKRVPYPLNQKNWEKSVIKKSNAEDVVNAKATRLGCQYNCKSSYRLPDFVISFTEFTSQVSLRISDQGSGGVVLFQRTVVLLSFYVLP